MELLIFFLQCLHKENENVKEATKRSNGSEDDDDDEDYDPSYGVKRLSVTDAGATEEDTECQEGEAVVKAYHEIVKEDGLRREPGASVVTTTVDPMTGRRLRQRQVRTTAAYGVAQRAGIGGLVEKFGLSAEQFADNVRDQYRRHEVNPCPTLPLDAAAGFVCKQFTEPVNALCAARYMLALQISREPVVRQLARMNLSTQTVLDLKPTCKGMRLIDELHPLSHVKFLKNKPVTELMGDVTYLHIHNVGIILIIHALCVLEWFKVLKCFPFFLHHVGCQRWFGDDRDARAGVSTTRTFVAGGFGTLLPSGRI